MKSQNIRIEESYQNRPNVHISYQQKMRPYHKKVAELVVKYAKDSATVLDIGCGIGHTLVEIQKRNPNLQLTAADIDDTTLAITKERIQDVQTIKIDSVEDLFGTGRYYDVIVMSHVLEHTYRPLDNVHGLVNMLQPDGILILAVPNPVRLAVFIGNIFKIHYVNRGHVYAWDRSHWMNFLENIAGVDVIEYSQDFFPLPVLNRIGFVRSIEIWLGTLFPWLSFSNIAVIRAPLDQSQPTGQSG